MRCGPGYRRAVYRRATLFPSALCLALAGSATPAAGLQDSPIDPPACTKVSRVFIDNHSIFDLSKIEERGRLGWAFRLVNRLHYRTTEGFIRKELLFEPGDCFEPFLVDESARLLRQYKFFAEADAFAVAQPDGSQHVVVETKDEWTTKLDIGASFDEGFKFETIELTEENFLGRGLELEAFFQERRERRDAGVRLLTTRLFGTRTNGRFEFGRTRVGRFGTFEVSYPFVGEGGRFAFHQSFDRRESLFAYSVPRSGMPAPGEITNAVVPVEAERFVLAAAARAGEPGNLRMLGLAITRESVRFPDYPGSVEVVTAGDFGMTLPAGDSIESIVSPQVRDAWKTRFNALFGWRKLAFARRRSLDSMRGVQDVELGSDVAFTFGLSPGSLGSGGQDVSDDLYTRISLFQGLEWGETLIAGRFLSDGRYVLSDGALRENWQDIQSEADLYFYWLPSGSDHHTVFARVSGTGSWNIRFPYQLTLGGREAVRGYGSDQFPGGRRVLATLEDRVRISWPRPDLIDVGFSFFVDSGRMWAGDAPFGEDTGWRTSVGAGLRLGFPAESRSVVRLDLALPVGGGASFSDLLFRVSLREFLGLLRGFDDEQSVRSRIIGVGADIFQTQR
ncbi:MAG: hypothetical protein ACI9OJ_003943 [Myxococcota bacterium]|jgi:hypothetical protein